MDGEGRRAARGCHGWPRVGHLQLQPGVPVLENRARETGGPLGQGARVLGGTVGLHRRAGRRTGNMPVLRSIRLSSAALSTPQSPAPTRSRGSASTRCKFAADMGLALAGLQRRRPPKLGAVAPDIRKALEEIAPEFSRRGWEAGEMNSGRRRTRSFQGHDDRRLTQTPRDPHPVEDLARGRRRAGRNVWAESLRGVQRSAGSDRRRKGVNEKPMPVWIERAVAFADRLALALARSRARRRSSSRCS